MSKYGYDSDNANQSKITAENMHFLWWKISRYVETYNMHHQGSGAGGARYSRSKTTNKSPAFGMIKAIASKSASALSGFLLPSTGEDIVLEADKTADHKFYERLSVATDRAMKTPIIEKAISSAILTMLNYGNACIKVFPYSRFDNGPVTIGVIEMDLFDVTPCYNIFGTETIGFDVAEKNEDTGDSEVMSYRRVDSLPAPNKYFSQSWTKKVIVAGSRGLAESKSFAPDPGYIYSRYAIDPYCVYGTGPGAVCLGEFARLETLRGDGLHWSKLLGRPPALIHSGLKDAMERSFSSFRATQNLYVPDKVITVDSPVMAGPPVMTLLPEIDRSYADMKQEEVLDIIRVHYLFDVTVSPMFAAAQNKSDTTATEVDWRRDEQVQQTLAAVQGIRRELIKPLIRKVAEMIVSTAVIEKDEELGYPPEDFFEGPGMIRYLDRFDLIMRASESSAVKELVSTMAALDPIMRGVTDALSPYKTVEAIVRAHPVSTGLFTSDIEQEAFDETIRENNKAARENEAASKAE